MSLFKYGYSFKIIRPLTVKKKDLALNDVNIPGLKKIFFQFLNKLLGSQKEKKECKNFLYREFIQYISYHLAYQTVWKKFMSWLFFKLKFFSLKKLKLFSRK